MWRHIRAWRGTQTGRTTVAASTAQLRDCDPGVPEASDRAGPATTAENAGVRKTATGAPPTPSANVAKLRPRAARILPDA
ncbi:hypothetical protein QQY24_31480 [Streptomyces sp. TG1A-8]|uniref:hypothetical protein n=1 Tax=Streptomyces sp. TG1A-8 TaxID=3051385 RepID=UPI00265B8ED7|nr:hypothetical protein [Streptomyces sp. TG1A-8]MDO0929661.1 hypothetical protein [Streptomyces sp. TG1A-8]